MSYFAFHSVFILQIIKLLIGKKDFYGTFNPSMSESDSVLQLQYIFLITECRSFDKYFSSE